jgi:hypothetical protein
VLRIQPSEAIYVKINAKTPGLYTRAIPTEMDLTYKRRFTETKIPEAYEALILDAVKGDHSNFVRDDELDVAWKVGPHLLWASSSDQFFFEDIYANFALDRRPRWSCTPTTTIPIRIARTKGARVVHRQVWLQACGYRIVSLAPRIAPTV